MAFAQTLKEATYVSVALATLEMGLLVMVCVRVCVSIHAWLNDAFPYVAILCLDLQTMMSVLMKHRTTVV